MTAHANAAGRLRRYSWLLVSLLAATGIVAYYLYFSVEEAWVRVPGEKTVNVKRSVLNQLGSITGNDQRVRPGERRELMTLMTPMRSSLALHVAEADFTPSRIDGAENWADLLGGGAVLVNSVDERHRNDGALSKKIAAGCALKSISADEPPAEIGDVTVDVCSGPYKEQGILFVGNAAIIVWQDDSGRRRCHQTNTAQPLKAQDDGFASDDGYVTCVSGWVRYATSDLLFRLRSLSGEPRTVVIPALATGVGEVPPEAIYQAYRRVIEDMLMTPEDAQYLPNRIVFLLWRGWAPNVWAAHQIAISNLTAELHNKWVTKATKHRQPAPLAVLLGVLLGLVCVVLATALAVRSMPRSLGTASQSRLTMTLLGWGLASLGFVTVLQATLSPVLGTTVPVSLCLGLFAVLSAVVVEQARDAFRKDLGDAGRAGADDTSARSVTVDAELSRMLTDK